MRHHLRHTFEDLPIGATFWFAKRQTSGGVTYHGVAKGPAYVKVDDHKYRDLDDPSGRRGDYHQSRRDALVSRTPPTSRDRAGAGTQTTKKRTEPVFACMECGRKFRTVGAAQRAVNQGCPGCGGSDVDLYVPTTATGVTRRENMAKSASRRVENNGLTFAEWLAAAGGRAHVDAVIQSGTTAQKAWRGGEDPTEYRAADAAKIRAFKERRHDRRENMTTANMAKSKARVRLGKKALSAPTRVATLAELGHRYDPDAFYSVKAGKLHVRHRRVGRGLGKATALGPVPGFRRGLFYYVARGVVYARSRK